jgi:hypothetical protein
MLRRFLTVFVVALLPAVLPGRVWAGADDDFIAIYNLIQQADSFRETGQVATAREAYGNAQRRLRELQRGYPTWNERVVNYRLRYVAEKMAALPESASRATPEPLPVTPRLDPGPAPAGEVIEQFNSLTAEIGRLTSDKKLLEARLREALTAQPAPVDPREFQQAVEKIASLQATNRVLVTDLEKQQADRKNLVERVVAEEARAALNEANRQLLAQKTAASALQKERGELESQLKKLQDGELRQLKNDNATLKSQVTELRSDTERGRQVADLTARLGKLQAKMEEATRVNEQLGADKAKLEKQLDDIRSHQTEESIVRLNKLQTDLAVARAEAGRNAAKAEEIVGQLTREKSVRIRLEQDNQTLTARVSALTGQLEAAKSLEAALVTERTERAEVEAQLKAAERRLAAVSAPRPAAGPGRVDAPAVDPAATAQLKLLEGEAVRLREALRDSHARESEIRTLLSEAEGQRLRAVQERTELARRLAQAEQLAAASPRAEDAKTIRSLEQRVRALERQRDELSRRILSANQRLTSQQAAARLQWNRTPRERAADFRVNR